MQNIAEQHEISNETHPDEEFFELHEMFVSTTDKNGIIQSGNPVFVRVSGHSEERLMGAPHNLIRHPDMPKTVFKFFWDTLKKGEPIVAYVKNRSANGKYYWVVAAVVPTNEGYLSCRIKPSQGTLSIVEDLYRRLCIEEKKIGLDQGVQWVLKELNQLGFSSYSEFMTDMLRKELNHRQSLLKGRTAERTKTGSSNLELTLQSMVEASKNSKRRLFEATEGLSNLLDQKQKIQTAANQILMACDQLEYLSLNMSVTAHKLGKEGQVLSWVSTAFQNTAKKVSERFRCFSKDLGDVSDAMLKMSLESSLVEVQAEMIGFYANETLASISATKLEDLRRLIEMVVRGAAQSSTTQSQALQKTREFLIESRSLRSLVSSLDLIRLGGRLEGSRSISTDQSFGPFIQEMNQFIAKVEGPIQQIGTIIDSLLTQFEMIVVRFEDFHEELVKLQMLESRVQVQKREFLKEVA